MKKDQPFRYHQVESIQDETCTEILQATADESVKAMMHRKQITAENLENDTMANRLEEINLHMSTKEKRLSRLCKMLYNILKLHASKIMVRIIRYRLETYARC